MNEQSRTSGSPGFGLVFSCNYTYSGSLDRDPMLHFSMSDNV